MKIQANIPIKLFIYYKDFFKTVFDICCREKIYSGGK